MGYLVLSALYFGWTNGSDRGQDFEIFRLSVLQTLLELKNQGILSRYYLNTTLM